MTSDKKVVTKLTLLKVTSQANATGNYFCDQHAMNRINTKQKTINSKRILKCQSNSDSPMILEFSLPRISCLTNSLPSCCKETLVSAVPLRYTHIRAFLYAYMYIRVYMREKTRIHSHLMCLCYSIP